MQAHKRGRPSLAPRAGRPGTKWCNKGRHFVLVTEFRRRTDGYYAAYCKECERAYDRDRKREEAKRLSATAQARSSLG